MNDLDNHFCHIFERWKDVIASLEDEYDYDIYIRPLELQTVSDDPVVLTVIIPETMDEMLYESNYKIVLIDTIKKVTKLACEDIYFVTQSEMEQFYQECDKIDKEGDS